MKYSNYRVFIDSPALKPSLGFDSISDALSQIAVESDPRFAIGIFGEWGSGKTTLMRDIQRKLNKNPEVISVWFNAWRYEREPHLIVPLIDQLRARLSYISNISDNGNKNLIQKTAAAMGRAGAALLSGFTLSAKLPVLGEAALDFSKVMEELGKDPQVAKKVLSFYSASFEMINEAVEEFSEEGKRRIVIFIDDLDRCLPKNALEVLESMKLLFDLTGFVFVVGLNQTVIQDAVEEKYLGERYLYYQNNDNSALSDPIINGSDYIKKIFQVPFSIPLIQIEQLNEYFDSLLTTQGLKESQKSVLREHVRPHLEFLSLNGVINPREIKRILNAFIIQLKMLEPRMKDNLNPNVVITIQVLSFRKEWEEIYDKLLIDSKLVVESIDKAIQENLSSISIYGKEYKLPNDLVTYLQRDFTSDFRNSDLSEYLTSVESTRSTDTSLIGIQVEIGKIRLIISKILQDNATENDKSEFSGSLDHLEGRLHESSLINPSIIKKLDLKSIMLDSKDKDRNKSIINDLSEKLNALDDNLFELRRRTRVD